MKGKTNACPAAASPINPNTQPDLQNKTITENGTYTADTGYDGLGTVTVNVSGTADTRFDDLADGSLVGDMTSVVSRLRGYAFAYITGECTFDLPNVTSVQGYTFYSSPHITAINMPLWTGATTDGREFFGCSELTQLSLPSATLPIAITRYYGCTNLYKLDFGSQQLVNILNSTMALYNCVSLTQFIIRRTDAVVTLGGSSLFNTTPIASGTGYIYVPDALVNDYKVATNWSVYADQIKGLSELPT